mmetsp:Transcript_10483/g.42784  ORF Transcript_10483/g.42784 Transcript_10483/m.42784 type:complete len:291 (-) Transcript_10483:278-1150(-)|eukprot:CAMPEP_0114617480 /NCGR_PEP_ID=MMETSP0168-20121206/7219_1 /TAXON_ID=95228 ORGANISM="Vannella sp., Strain DIVA3 517/6/12" /NCGR_SAMPLE_ID=MMETSP0168 /ASSEMBLY_ACC=CAM_ASM_000044 /LENGTH=290 /DNA_ID=CAMNT_0001828617 /DNA_START=46 /DNA_END=918 /DNA_ORIENTATION=-
MIDTDSLNLPRLALSGQTALSTDRCSDNGFEKNLHYVIKNNTYSVAIALPSSVKPSFSSLTLEAEILYDSQPKPKDVFQVKATPFKYKAVVDSKNKRQCTFEFQVSVLSSQHEDMNFLVHIVCKDSATSKLVAEGYSEPMQCISKPDVLRKKRGVKTKKRTWNDRVTETLERLEEMQRATLALVADQPSAKSAKLDGPLAKPCVESPSEKFERGFRTMLEAYSAMSTENRAFKVRKMASSASASEQQTFLEMTDQFFVEGMANGTVLFEPTSSSASTFPLSSTSELQLIP